MAVMAAQHIVQGQFVAQYAGEVLTNKQADIRLAQYDTQDASAGHALLVGIWFIPSAITCQYTYDHLWVTVNVLFFSDSSRDASLWQSLPASQY